MSVGTAFHPATAPLNRKQQWREWSGYFASSAYADAHDIEYNAIREAAALIDVSPLYKYVVGGPDAQRLVDRVITRDATKLQPGQVYYTPWCDEHGKVIDDGTVHRLDDDTYRWTAADPQLRWLRMNSAGLDVDDRRRLGVDRRGRAPGAAVARRPRGGDRRSRSRICATSGGAARRSRPAGSKVAIDVSRTGYTGDLGYELWVDADQAVALWQALTDAGAAYGIRPAGMLALDVVRLEAGLILLEVDYTSARHAMNPEQNYSPGEIGLGRLVSLDKADFVGRLALEREAKAGGPSRRLVGLQLDWHDIEGLFSAQGLPPAISPVVDRSHRPVYVGGRQVGRATSVGWSPILKQAIALASVPPSHEAPGAARRRGVVGRGAPRPRRGHGRRAAVPRPGAKAGLGHLGVCPRQPAR